MIVSFGNAGTGHLFNGKSSKAARKVCPPHLHSVAARKLDTLAAAKTLGFLASPGNHLEALRGTRWSGFHTIRINKAYRICFRWTDHGPEEVQVTKHYDRG